MRNKNNLSKGEYQELLGLEYILTWGYSDDEKTDSERYIYLTNKLWVHNRKISPNI